MRFIIGFLIAIGLLIFAFILIFRGGDSSKTQIQGTQMLDYTNTSVVVQLTTEGPVSADKTHKEVRITVGNNESTIETFQGYQGTLLSTRSYANNPAAYADFLRALDIVGYTKGNSDKNVADERGYCPDGRRYVMNIKDGDKDIQRFWSSSCGTGTFKGKTASVLALFDRQIPDYETITGSLF